MEMMDKYMEEIHDYKEYKKMHREAKEHECHELAFWLDRIAADERSHAKWLHDYLCDKGKMTEAGKAAWEEMK